MKAHSVGKKPVTMFDQRCVCIACKQVFSCKHNIPLAYCGCRRNDNPDLACFKQDPTTHQRFQGLNDKRLHFKWFYNNIKGLSLHLTLHKRENGVNMMFTAMTVLQRNWLAVVLWQNEDGSFLTGIHNIVSINKDANTPQKYLNLENALKGASIVIKESSAVNSPTQEFSIDFEGLSPVIEFVPKEQVAQCVRDGSLNNFMRELGIENAKIFCKLK